MDRAKKTRVKTPPLVGLRCPATDFEQVCGAAQAALRISCVVSDVVRAHGVAGGRSMARFKSETSYASKSTAESYKVTESGEACAALTIYIIRTCDCK